MRVICLFYKRALVSFAKEPYKRDDIPHKRPVLLMYMNIYARAYVSMSSSAAQHSKGKGLYYIDTHTHTHIDS